MSVIAGSSRNLVSCDVLREDRDVRASGGVDGLVDHVDEVAGVRFRQRVQGGDKVGEWCGPVHVSDELVPDGPHARVDRLVHGVASEGLQRRGVADPVRDHDLQNAIYGMSVARVLDRSVGHVLRMEQHVQPGMSGEPRKIGVQAGVSTAE